MKKSLDEVQKMNRNTKLISLVIAALLCAIGIVIPMFAPKIVFEPVSFTLASHVPIFIALFISPPVAITVTLGSTVGFFFAGFPLVIVLRALSHLIFVAVGAALLKKNPDFLSKVSGMVSYGLILAVIHALSEVAVVTWFYFGNSMAKSYYSYGYIFSVLVLGIGTIVHSMVDYGIAVVVWRPVTHVIQIPVSAKSLPKRKQAVL
jgi:niacin transporter